MDFLLGLGIGTDTVTDDRIDLTADPYHVLADRFRVEEDAADGRYVYVMVGLHIRAESNSELLNAHSAIIDKLSQATIGGSSIQDWVTLGVRTSASEEMVWWHVVDGGITAPGQLFPSKSYIGHIGDPFELTLRCHYGAFSAAIEDEGVVVTGDDPTLYREGIPGTLPAYVEAVVTDNSTNSVVLHGIGVGSRSAKSMADADFEPFQELTADGIGSLIEDEPDTFGDNCIRATPGLNWATMAYASPTEDQMKGRYDLWLRVKDGTPLLDTPEGVSLTAVAGANQRQKKKGIGDTSVSVSGYTLTLPGSTLFLDVYAAHNSSTPAVSSVPSGFTLVESSTQSNMLVATYIYPDAPAMSADLTVTLTNSLESLVVMEEWTGLTSSPTDVTADNNVSSNNVSHPTGTTGTTASANTLARTAHIFVDVATGSGYTVDGYTSGYSKSYGEELRYAVFPTSYRRKAYGYYRILTSTGTQSATLTTSSGTVSANLIATYTMTAGGALASDSYHYRVSAIDGDGRLSRASTTVTVYHPAGNAATQLEWEPSLSPAVVAYRVFARKATGSWVYFDTADTTPAFMHVTMSGPDGTADPPDVGLQPANLRLGFAIGDSGRVLHTTRTVMPKRANDVWEWVRFSTDDLPVLARPVGIAQPDYRVTVEVRNGEAEVDADVLAFVPADEAFFDTTVDYELAAAQEWVIGTNAAGHRFAWVRDPNDATDVSGAISEGTFSVGPGDSKLLFLFRSEDGQSVVDDVSTTAQLTLYPRWHWLAGSL